MTRKMNSKYARNLLDRNSCSFIFQIYTNICLSMCDVKVFLTFTFTEYGTVLTTILPILYLNTVIVTAGALEPY